MNEQSDKNEAAAALARLNAGKPRQLSEEERARRRERMVAINKARGGVREELVRVVERLLAVGSFLKNGEQAEQAVREAQAVLAKAKGGAL